MVVDGRHGVDVSLVLSLSLRVGHLFILETFFLDVSVFLRGCVNMLTSSVF
jgi:hypothetical protein